MVAPAPSRLGTIVAGDYRYALTAEDVLWLGRSLACEAGGNREAMEGIVWTYAARLVASFQSKTMVWLVQNHSQPLNPVWRRDGNRCRAPDGEWYNRCQTTTDGRRLCPCNETALARRERCQTLRWEQLAASVRETITAFVAGVLPNPVPRSVDFAAGLRGKPGMELVREIGRTQFWSSPGSRRWPENFVRVVGPTGSSAVERPSVMVASAGGNAGATLLVTALAVGAGVYFWQASRG